ncbi:MAG: hypothetical protein NVSMB52_20190 [Chloroflexota bacterium]
MKTGEMAPYGVKNVVNGHVPGYMRLLLHPGQCENVSAASSLTGGRKLGANPRGTMKTLNS